MKKKDCSNCCWQLTGFDGGFCGEPMTCECRVFGETKNRKNCNKWKKRITKDDLWVEIRQLRKENEQLRQQLRKQG